MDFAKVLKAIRGQVDRVAAWIAVVLAGVVLLLGWLGVSGSSLPSEQIPYIISGGLGGLVLAAVGATLWLSADLADEWRKLDDIHAELRQIREQGSPISISTNGNRAPEAIRSSPATKVSGP